MSPRLGDRDLSPEQYEHTLAVLVEQGFANGDWTLFAHAIQIGMSDEGSRIQAFCRLAEVIMRMRFANLQSDDTVQSFLENELHLEEENARTVVLMTVLAAKKAVEISQEGKSRETAVSELEKDYAQNSELAGPMVETGLSFLVRSNPKSKLFLALVVLLCTVIPAAFLSLSIGVVLYYTAEFFWWTSSLIGLLTFVTLRICGAQARAKLFGVGSAAES